MRHPFAALIAAMALSAPLAAGAQAVPAVPADATLLSVSSQAEARRAPDIGVRISSTRKRALSIGRSP